MLTAETRTYGGDRLDCFAVAIYNGKTARSVLLLRETRMHGHFGGAAAQREKAFLIPMKGTSAGQMHGLWRHRSPGADAP